jgi:DNA-directed RNA polymerase subunit RPC12/RpoP
MKFFKHLFSSKIIEQEERPNHCACGDSSFIITEGDTLYTCESCGQRYRATLMSIYDSLKCPDCDEPLMSGPRGGMMMNIACTNGHKFNISTHSSCRIVERIT